MLNDHESKSNLTIDKIKMIEQINLDYSVNAAIIMDYFKSYIGERYIFINKDKSFKLMGIGHRALIVEDTINPISIENQFKSLLHEATYKGDRSINDLKLFGGFQFDDNESPNFSAYYKSHFIIPEIQILEVNGKASIIFVDQNHDISDIIDGLKNHTMTSIAENKIQETKDMDLDLFKANATKAIAMMNKAELEKVVLSRKRKITMQNKIDILTLVEQAMKNHEVSYFALIESANQTFITKTPEQLVAVQKGELLTNAIAGTMGKDVPDAKQQLLDDEKNLYEHKIVVESIKDDLAPFTQEITLKGAPDILENQFFYHLYTPIKAKLQTGSLLEVTESLHPTPALGGFPKNSAMQFLNEANEGRGLYGAPLGYLDMNDEGEFIVAIRSMIIEDNTAMLYAGCGLVKSSVVESEVYETEIKFKPMLEMLGVN
ncbi:isochorismate synthase [Macrococcus sp. EM39E]|uniref:isochorismate synthase n=1 Tax=Macrococcus animalis TaxID=3395467 RepID=UPI0039BE42F8